MPALPGLGSGPGPLRVPWDTYPPSSPAPRPTRTPRPRPRPPRSHWPSPTRPPAGTAPPRSPGPAPSCFSPRSAGGRAGGGQRRELRPLEQLWVSSLGFRWAGWGGDGAEGGRTGAGKKDGRDRGARRGRGKARPGSPPGWDRQRARRGQIPPGNRSWPHVAPQLLRCWFSPLSHCGEPTGLVRAIRAPRYAGPPGFKLSFRGASSCPLVVTQSPCRSPGKHTDSLSGQFPR